MSKILNKFSKKMAAVAITAALLVPVTGTAAQAVTGWTYGTSGIAWDFGKRWAWSQFTTSADFHGSSVFGDIDGLKRSKCLNKGAKAYAQSKYTAFGGAQKPYYRYC
ncbi:hypothetical protein ACFO7V_03155 [Glutamicibacter bergerei]|uniref:Lactococcin 972 family bacteriocin n=1 Tax=Glutamicibacter bergerei TaxID=256702 RepID=A0ABV9MGW3_9MICC|nr:hypothetical protein [Micrococcaceae bacterium]